MKPMKNLIYITFVIFLFSCSMGKTLDREVLVKINSNIPISIFNEGISNYSGKYTETDYKENFLKGMKSNFGTSNVTVTDMNAEFEINIDQYTVTESTRMEKVTDSTATNFGQEYELSTIVVKSNGSVVRMSDGVSYPWSVEKNKSEKLTNMQSASQIVSGENKDMKEYREKHFDENEAISLTYKCGNKSGIAIVKKIFKSLK